MSKYDNFTFFDENLYLDAPEIDTVVANLITPIKEHIKKHAEEPDKNKRWQPRYTDHLRLILLNLCHIHDQDPTRYVAYSRDKNRYTELNKKPRRYRCSTLRFESMTLIVDCLRNQDFGLIEHRNGSYHRNDDDDTESSDNTEGEINEMARMRATPKLIDSFANIHKIPVHKITSHPDKEIVVLRNRKKVEIKRGKNKGQFEWRKFDVPYRDTATTDRMRHNLKQINNLIDEHFIGLTVLDDVINQMRSEMVSKAMREKGKVRNVDFSKTRSRRIFNNRSWEQGGRFYGGWWQDVPKDYRKDIRIDNLSTVEIDYSGLHFMLMYLEEGFDLPEEDVYELGPVNEIIERYIKHRTESDLIEATTGCVVEGPGQLKMIAERIYKVAARDYLKKAANEESAIKAINYRCRAERKEAPFLKNKRTKDLIKMLSDKHSKLGNIFYTGRGVFLQNIDSNLAERVMLILAEKGIPALPIHDSFIVSRLHEDDLRDAMSQATTEKYKTALGNKSKGTAWGWIYEIGIEEEVRDVASMESLRWTSEEGCSEYYRRMEQYERRTGKQVLER